MHRQVLRCPPGLSEPPRPEAGVDSALLLTRRQQLVHLLVRPAGALHWEVPAKALQRVASDAAPTALLVALATAEEALPVSRTTGTRRPTGSAVQHRK